MTEPVDIPVEYRLYYDDKGDPLHYICGCFSVEDPGIEGKFIVLDHFQFLCRRYDIKVVNGKILPRFNGTVIYKLVQTTGIRCASEDISIPVTEEYTGKTIEWGMKISERTDH